MSWPRATGMTDDRAPKQRQVTLQMTTGEKRSVALVQYAMRLINAQRISSLRRLTSIRARQAETGNSEHGRTVSAQSWELGRIRTGSATPEPGVSRTGLRQSPPSNCQLTGLTFGHQKPSVLSAHCGRIATRGLISSASGSTSTLLVPSDRPTQLPK